jgi:hypothetical protein
MEEEIKNPDLERISKEITINFSNKPHQIILREILEREGKKVFEFGNTENYVHMDETNKYAEFYGEYKKKGRFMKELEPLLNYLNSNGYRTNLD